MREKPFKVGVLLLLAALAASTSATGQVRSIYDQGSGALVRQLQRLQTTASVLHTGAHPDDEDSALIAYHARRQNARTAYLSLTRGSGGQNIIGTEQSNLLGIIRTEELLQARRLDGAEQFFTRAVDYGFSKYREEASRLWNEEDILADMVRVIRTFRPNVIVSRWNGTPADGHGHHQFAGYLTPIAFEAAADPKRFPEQLAAGLKPWRVQKLYVIQRGSNDESGDSILVIDTGDYDPVSGRTYFQIGMHGRSQQKTQQMGTLELMGRQESVLRLVRSVVDTSQSAAESNDKLEREIFAGIDTSIRGIANYEARPSRRLVSGLEKLQALAADVLSDYHPLNSSSLVPKLADGLSLARELRGRAISVDAIRLLDEKAAEFSSALISAAGITVDALADSETVVPGGELQAAVRLYDTLRTDTIIKGVSLAIPEGWESARIDDVSELANEQANRRKEQPAETVFFNVSVSNDAKPTEPYWLENPHDGFTHNWSGAESSVNLPFAAPLIVANLELEIAGQSVVIARELEYRFVDRVRGEVRRRINVVPQISLNAATNLVILPMSVDKKDLELQIALKNNGDNEAVGQVWIDLPDGWRSELATLDFSLAGSPASTSKIFKVTLPDNVLPAKYTISAKARVGDVVFHESMDTVAYDHIGTHRDYRQANIDVQIIDVEVAPVHVGYVMGSGDDVPAGLQRLGLDVTLLDDAALATGDMSRYDTIVVGIRASQTRSAFVANNSRLLEFARNGGTLVVQYQQHDYLEKGLAPYPASMGERTVRVVDETAAVKILQPDHPIFTFPNRITQRDFDDWVQERNNYNFATFDDDHYVALTESHDDGEPESFGGMVYAEIGDGHFVYTGYSWFRQLPNGVPGAYRLFANLVSLPAVDR